MSPARRMAVAVAGSSSKKIGMAVLLGLVALFLVLGLRPNIEASLPGRDTIKVEFSNSYKLAKFKSTVKIHGLEVGSVYDLEYSDDKVVAELRLDDGVRELLGSKPSATIEQVNVLGGRYTVDLVPGGDRSVTFEGVIPLERTQLPTELDQVVGALTTKARDGLQGTARKAAPTLASAQQPLSDALGSLPSFLEPGAVVLDAATGTRPGQDLPDLVSSLDSVSEVTTKRDGQLERITADLNATADVLARRTPELESTLRNLPTTLTQARDGLAALSVTVDKLEVTADRLEPTVPKLEKLVEELNPTLKVAQPVLADLQPALADARPAVEELVPTAKTATAILDDLEGPVLDRAKGPISTFVLTPWKGGDTAGFKGLPASPYQRDHTFYEEAAYMATNINRASMTQDQYGSTLAFQAGVGLETLTDGLPGSFPFTPTGILQLALGETGLPQAEIDKIVHDVVPTIPVGSNGGN